MEKIYSSHSDSPVKSVRKGEYKVQFADASECCKDRVTILGKPPEVPRSSCDSLRMTTVRPTGGTTTSTCNLNTVNSHSLGSKLNKGSTSSSSIRSDSFGSTTSLDRRRQGSVKIRLPDRSLQPITDAERSQSLDRRRQERSLGEGSSSLANCSERKKRERNEPHGSERRLKLRSPYESISSGSSPQYLISSRERHKFSSRPKTSHPNINSIDSYSQVGNTSTSKSQALLELNGASDNGHNSKHWMQKIKRTASRSPVRKSAKCSISRLKEEENENDKRKDRSSRCSSERKPEEERGRSLKRDAVSGRLNPDQWNNNNLEDMWSFEPGVMWSRTLNNRRIGYLMFSCNNLDTPRGEDAFPTKFNMSYKFSPQADSKLIRLVLESHGFMEVNSNSSSFNLCWSNTHFNPNEIRNLQDWQKVNHFPRSSELTRKDRLYLNIKRMQRQFGVKLFDFIPTSFVLPTEHREFCETHLRERGTWIVKPVASSQGKGIYLVSQIDQVPADETSLISRYIESPLLVNGYKCDLRLYVTVTSLDPLLVYMFEEGLVRLATVKYQQKKNLWNPCIHLTNYSVNKFHSNYVHNQDPEVDNQGSKWSLSAFLRFLRSRGIDTAALMRSVEDVIIKSLLAAAYQMNTATSMFVPHARNCFELYGFDILIDEHLKPWVLEVNLSPSLNIDQPLDLKIKSSMLADLFSLAGLLICNPNTTKLSSRPSVYRKLPNLRYSTESYERQSMNRAAAPAVSAEELRLVRQVAEEYQRRGGWARIFPTPDSWSVYGGLQEYSSPLNLVLHTHLYPHVQRNTRLRVARCSLSSSTGLASSLERLTCYERPLPKGLAFIRDKLGLGKQREERRSPYEAHEIKQNLLEALENGLKLSKYQARMAFSVYLQHVQRRLMIGCNQENQTDLVYRFLRSASRTLHLPISVQSPSKNLPEEARAVVISKQLGDFIMAYTKETHIHYDPPITAPLQSDQSSDQQQEGDPPSELPLPSSSSSALPVTLAVPSSSSQSYERRTVMTVISDTGGSDKSVRFSTDDNTETVISEEHCDEGSADTVTPVVCEFNEKIRISRFPSTSSFNDITPSDVTDPLNPMLPSSGSCTEEFPTAVDAVEDSVALLQPPSISSEALSSSSYSGVDSTQVDGSGTAAVDVAAHSYTIVPHLPSVLSLDCHDDACVVPLNDVRVSESDVDLLAQDFCTGVSSAISTSCYETSTGVPFDSGNNTDQTCLTASVASSDGSSLASVRNLSICSLTTSDLATSIMTASNDSFSSLSTSALSGSYLSASLHSSSSLTNSFSSVSIPLSESSSSASISEDLSINTYISSNVTSSNNTIVTDDFNKLSASLKNSAAAANADTHNFKRRISKTAQKIDNYAKYSFCTLPSVHHQTKARNIPKNVSPYASGPRLTRIESLAGAGGQSSVPDGNTKVSSGMHRYSHPYLYSSGLVASATTGKINNRLYNAAVHVSTSAVTRSSSFPPQSFSVVSSAIETQLANIKLCEYSNDMFGSPSALTTHSETDNTQSCNYSLVKCNNRHISLETTITSGVSPPTCSGNTGSHIAIALPCVPSHRRSYSSSLCYSRAATAALHTDDFVSTAACVYAPTVLSTVLSASTAPNTSTALNANTVPYISTDGSMSTASSTLTQLVPSTLRCVKASSKLPLRKMNSLDADYAVRPSDGDSGATMSSSGSSWRGGVGEDGEDGPRSTADAGEGEDGGTGEESDTIAMELYRAFMSAAREADLEEVLSLQTRLHNSAGMFLDSARRCTSAANRHQHHGGGGGNSRPRTPTASPHGSPRRGRKSPSMHGSQSRLAESQQQPDQLVLTEPQSGNSSRTNVSSAASADKSGSLSRSSSTEAATAAGGFTAAAQLQVTSASSKAGTTVTQSGATSSCCLFGNILKASLKGTNTTFSV